MSNKIDFITEVLDNQPLGTNQRLITFKCPAIAEKAQPGQFVALSCSRFLRRPLGVARVDRQQGTVSVGGRAKGEGMADILALKTGDKVKVLGPLGHGFDLTNLDGAIVVGGGTGVYPMLFLLDELKHRGVTTGAAFGFRSQAMSVLVDEFKDVADHCVIASEAGDLDVPGDVMVALEEVGKHFSDKNNVAVLTCGPKPMMEKVADYAKSRGYSCQVSLEERMACGVGLCLVCVCQIKDKDKTSANPDGWHYERCCKEGPVFRAEEIIW